MKVLVTGGAGYVGCIVVRELLQSGHKIRIFDNLRKGGTGLLAYFSNPSIEFIHGDIRNPEAVEKVVKGMDVIIHLAAIVGEPACSKDRWMAREVNVDGTINLVKKRLPKQLIIFPSSLSNYGTVVGATCTEDMNPQPLSLYGITKLEAEKLLLKTGHAIIFRPATAFGLSPQMRLDLLFNDFVYRAVKDKYLLLYEPHFMRAFIHVYDFAQALIFGMDNADRMVGQIYNLGNESLNLTKLDLAERIKGKVVYDIQISATGKDPDMRNYSVDFSKLKSLGYRTKISIDAGIEELIRGLPLLGVKNPFCNPDYY